MKTMLRTLWVSVKAWLLDVVRISTALFKVMIPTLLIIKALDEVGFTQFFAGLLSPLMQLLGLPDSMALVWATTLLTNIYAGMLIFISSGEALTVAQVSVIGGMMLMAHALPVETLIARQAGVRLRFSLLLRLGGGLLYGLLLHAIYSLTNTLDVPAEPLWSPTQTAAPPTLLLWLWQQLQSLVSIVLIIALLLAVLRLLRVLGIERLIQALLRPVLTLFGISRQATTIVLVGFTLGLSFGGGLLIEEARSGRLSGIDVFAAMTLIGLSHSMIEDTLLILLLGAHLSAVLWLRLLFMLVVGYGVIAWARTRSAAFQQRHLLRPPINPELNPEVGV